MPENREMRSCRANHSLLCILLFCTVISGFKRSTIPPFRSCLVDRISSFALKSSVRSEAADITKKLSALRSVRDRRRDDKLQADLAAQKAEIEYRDYRALHGHIEGSSFIPGTYDYGFNTQSNDILLVNKNSGLGGSVPAGIIKLAAANFKRELGNQS